MADVASTDISGLLDAHTPHGWALLVGCRVPTLMHKAWPPSGESLADFERLAVCSRSLNTLQPPLVFAALVCISVWCHALGVRYFGAKHADLMQYIWCHLMRNSFQVKSVLCSEPLALLIVDPHFWQYVGEHAVAEFPLPVPPRYSEKTWPELIERRLSPGVVKAARNAFA
jgi:hypothetical protein